MNALNARPLGFYSPSVKNPTLLCWKETLHVVGFTAAYSKCNFLQVQPFEKLVAVNIIIRQKCLVTGNKKAHSKIGRWAAENSIN